MLSLVIHEGRNRQVRKMCDAIGHPVVRLRRVRIGPITDDRLKPGQFRALTPREISCAQEGARARERRQRSRRVQPHRARLTADSTSAPETRPEAPSAVATRSRPDRPRRG